MATPSTPPPSITGTGPVAAWMRPVVGSPVHELLVDPNEANTKLITTIDLDLARLVEIRSRLMAANKLANVAKYVDAELIADYTLALHELGNLVRQTSDVTEQVLYSSEMVLKGAEGLR